MAAVEWARTEPQFAAAESTKKHPLFCGGFGSGKTEILVQTAIEDAWDGGADALIGLYEPTYDLITTIMVPRLTQALDRMGIKWTHNKRENRINTKHKKMGNFILRSMDNPERIVGFETFTSKIDEIDILSEEKAELAWNKILGRNRQNPKTLKPKEKRLAPWRPTNQISAFSTPEGFRFAHKRWMELGGDNYEIIKSPTYLNPYLPDDYVDTLRASYPPHLANAYIEGDFVPMSEGLVYKNYAKGLNTSDKDVDNERPLLIGMDFNVNPMSAIVGQIYENELHIVDELIIENSTTEEMAQAIVEKFPYHHQRDMVEIMPDAAGNQRRTSARTTDHEILRSAPYFFDVVVDPSNPLVRDRVNAVNAMILNGAGVRRLKIHPRCKTLIKCLQNQIYDKAGAPDKKGGYDHTNDALGYLIWQTFPIEFGKLMKGSAR